MAESLTAAARNARAGRRFHGLSVTSLPPAEPPSLAAASDDGDGSLVSQHRVAQILGACTRPELV